MAAVQTPPPLNIRTMGFLDNVEVVRGLVLAAIDSSRHRKIPKSSLCIFVVTMGARAPQAIFPRALRDPSSLLAPPGLGMLAPRHVGRCLARVVVTQIFLRLVTCLTVLLVATERHPRRNHL